MLISSELFWSCFSFVIQKVILPEKPSGIAPLSLTNIFLENSYSLVMMPMNLKQFNELLYGSILEVFILTQNIQFCEILGIFFKDLVIFNAAFIGYIVYDDHFLVFAVLTKALIIQNPITLAIVFYCSSLLQLNEQLYKH